MKVKLLLTLFIHAFFRNFLNFAYMTGAILLMTSIIFVLMEAFTGYFGLVLGVIASLVCFAGLFSTGMAVVEAKQHYEFDKWFDND